VASQTGTGTIASEAILAIARDLAREVHPRRRGFAREGLGSSFDRDWAFDSLTRAELLLRVERRFAVRLPENLLGTADTLNDILAALSQARGVAPGVPLPGSLPIEDVNTCSVPDAAVTLTEVLDWHVAAHATRCHLVLWRSEVDEERISYGDLRDRARSVARALRDTGLEPGERVALMLPTGRDFFEAFFGTLYAGGVPTPIYPPARPSQLAEHLLRQARILNNA
jgi:non-ribosomal peptide synthetase component F